MEVKPTHIAQEIKLKVLRLIAQKEQLLEQIQLLIQENNVLKSEIQQQKNTIETLQTQNKIVKLAEILPSTDEDKQELKKQLNVYIKQIDECIRLLSE
jgi:ABC-type phosphate transport system auxiliary subunit